MRTILLIIFSAISFTMCKEAEATYEGHYPQETFIKVLADLYVAEGALKDVDSDLKDSLISVYRSQIEAIHAVELNVVEKDLMLIQTKPTLYRSIHRIVSDSVVFMEKRMNLKKEKKISKPVVPKTTKNN